MGDRGVLWLTVLAVVVIGAVSGVLGLVVDGRSRVEVREVPVSVSPVPVEPAITVPDGGQVLDGPVVAETDAQDGSEDGVVWLVRERCGPEPSPGVDRVYWRKCRRELLAALI